MRILMLGNSYTFYNDLPDMLAELIQIIIAIIEARHSEIEALWIKKFGTISYYC